MEKHEYKLIPLAANTWAIDMMLVRAFLAVGETSALLIDTGAGGINLQEAVRACTDLPVRVVNTHAHYDHISGNGAFEMQFVHPMELTLLAKAGFSANPVSDGNGFDLGGRIVQVVGLPGHSPGSIGLWIAGEGLLFAGDTVGKGRPVFLQLEGASLEAYTRTLDRILSMEQDENGTVSRIFCCHGDLECTMDDVRALRALMERVMAGECEKEALPEPYAAALGENAGICRGDNGVSVLTG